MRLREQKLRDLGGLSLEMYRRDQFRADLLLERCAELIGLEARINELDTLLGAARPHAGRLALRSLRLRRTTPVGLPLLRELRPAGCSPGGGRRPVSESTPPRCPRCNATVGANQEYCLECGARLAHAPPGPLERTSAAHRTAERWAGPVGRPRAPRPGHRRPRHRCGDRDLQRRRGAERNLDRDRRQPDRDERRLDADRARADTSRTTTTAPATTTAPKPTTTPKPPANPAAIVWPRDAAAGRSCSSRSRRPMASPAANAKAAELSTRRASAASVSSTPGRYASLHPGYYVIFTGVFDSEAEASSSLQRARAVLPLHGLPARNHPVRHVGIAGPGKRVRSGSTEADSLPLLITNVNDFVTAPVVRILEVRRPPPNPIFGLCMGQNRER